MSRLLETRYSDEKPDSTTASSRLSPRDSPRDDPDVRSSRLPSSGYDRTDEVPDGAASAEPPRLPPVLRGADRVPARLLDAVRGAILARPRADELAVPARAARCPSVRAVPVPLARVGGHRRPAAPAPAPHRDADPLRPAVARAGAPRLDGARSVLGDRPPRDDGGLCQHAGSARAPGVRHGAGGTRRRA